VDSKLSIHTLAKLAQGKLNTSVAEQLKRHKNGDLKTGLRERLGRDIQVATLGDQELYYLIGHTVVPVEETPALEQALVAAWDPAVPFAHAERLARTRKALQDAGIGALYFDRNSYMRHAGAYYSTLVGIPASDWGGELILEGRGGDLVRIDRRN
jgi:hypothetical protein